MFIRSVKSNVREDKNDAYSEEQPMDSGALQYWSTGYQTWHVSTDWGDWWGRTRKLCLMTTREGSSEGVYTTKNASLCWGRTSCVDIFPNNGCLKWAQRVPLLPCWILSKATCHWLYQKVFINVLNFPCCNSSSFPTFTYTLKAETALFLKQERNKAFLGHVCKDLTPASCRAPLSPLLIPPPEGTGRE